jgi:predicted ArsR family transcriptional regulator
MSPASSDASAAATTDPAPPASAEGAPTSLSDNDFSAAVAAVTTAFGDPTRRDIYLFVRGTPGATATLVAEEFGLHSNVARHHLEKLTSGGYLEAIPGRGADGETRAAGRPSKRYRAAAEDANLSFPPRRDDILTNLLARALDLLEPEQAAAMADEVGYEYGRNLAARMGPADGHKSVKTALTIVSECCPFGSTAAAYPHVVCAVDRGMIRGMLAGLYGETTPRFEASRPAGDANCVTRV